MKQFNPKEITTQQVFSLLTGAIHPRPIALVATISENGNPNLAPFSFFNAFGANPPMIGFSPSCRVRDGSRKDTYYNLKRTKECTVQVVTFDMVEQVNLASTEYETGVDEFVKSGLTPVQSDLIAPPRVRESPVQMECRLDQIVHLGDGKGSGNLMLCEVLRFHVDESMLEGDVFNPYELDLVGRNGSNYYTRANENSLFEVKKPLLTKGIGYDQLPEHMKLSSVFTGNDLARFGNSEEIPSSLEAKELARQVVSTELLDENLDLFRSFGRAKQQKHFPKMLAIGLRLKIENHPQATRKIQESAQIALQQGNRDFAWKAALLVE